MENRKSLTYFRARKKVEMLKGFYSHLAVYIIVNAIIILVSANVFNHSKVDFAALENYATPFFWGFGIICHGLYVFFVLKVRNNFIRRWEERKIKEFLESDNFSQ